MQSSSVKPPRKDIIHIQNARTHNLKNITLDLPRQQLVVITGKSGSGKSSLAFDTLYAEGQRRYVESLSTYARQFLQLMDKPDVDLIEGLSPAIAIEQKTAGRNPRSTVGTTTEIHDYLRLLYARAGTPYCPIHHEPLQAFSISQIVDAVMAMPEQSKLMLLAPIPLETPAALPSVIDDLQAQGFIRIRLNQEVIELDQAMHRVFSDTDCEHLEVVVDRLKVRADNQQRLADSLETAVQIGHGRVKVLDLDHDKLLSFSTLPACAHCDYHIPNMEPRLFSFNNPMGACECCGGMGEVEVFDPQKVVAFPELSLVDGAIKGWDRRNLFSLKLLNSLAVHYDFDIEAPFERLPKTIQDIILYGSGTEEIDFLYLNNKGSSTLKRHTFEGIIPNYERRWQDTDNQAVKEELSRYRTTIECPECHGARLREAARHVFIGQAPRQDGGQGLAIYEVEALPLNEALDWFENLELSAAKQTIAMPILREIMSRLAFLNNVGLKYLSLDRRTNTISGGEAQRIRLAGQIGSGLSGVMYVLDEPSIGLHQRDNDRLIQTLCQLRDIGNSVIVVEHDEDMIKAANYVVDMGPGAGEHGGQIIAQGSPTEVMQNSQSLTGAYLKGDLQILQKQHRPVDADAVPWLQLSGCSGHNLKHVDLSLPLQRLVCVTGVSGSGKSTLINDTLAALLARELNRAKLTPAPFKQIQGLEALDKIINVDQSPIGRTPRSNPATYTGMFTPIRELFASTAEARARGYDSRRFSFNVKGGRCEHCQGDGVIKVEMHFLPDVYVPCDVCHGKRYNRETLEIRYRGLNISEVLELTVEEALPYFDAVPAIEKKLQTLMDVGLGYIRLGQSATTLSGGEAQRIKLSQELSKRSTGNTLYVLDEPTTGLHFADIDLLLQVLNQLVDKGNSVVVIEHNLDLIQNADWIIDMGPEGGSGGGQIIATGSPEQIAATPNSHTGHYLNKHLQRHHR
ncbi:excinuclease ABC subunit UvrA [Brackiella oedipodis]|uniref:excinuclease ABC subunit UvrA n=1 Tax=Brackiella oedipodis TaxID=124225 RepID=UPI00057051B8|nr:excinuclease ABC subunit UvrA [Brackiella oedipodis]